MTVKHRGKFITFEGLDGVGKSTQLEKLATHLSWSGLEVITTREPGGTAIGEKLRAVLLNSKTGGLSPLAELGLMFADRAQHVDELILPALAKGQWVLSDRFTDSSEAYQGGGRELGKAIVLQLHKTLCARGAEIWNNQNGQVATRTALRKKIVPFISASLILTWLSPSARSA